MLDPGDKLLSDSVPRAGLEELESKHNEKRTYLRLALSEIQYRTTSRIDDGAICIANFLGLDVAQILAIAPTVQDFRDHRMRRLIEMIIPVPECLLFARGPRLQIQSFRWAPRTVLSPYGLKKFPEPETSSGKDGVTLANRPKTCLDALIL
jgi:hypothetical protein